MKLSPVKLSFVKLPLGLTWKRIAIVVALYVIFLIATLPASLAVTALQKPNRPLAGISVGNVSGSIWSGRLSALQTQSFSLNELKWHLKPWTLLAGRLSVDIQGKRDDGYVDGTISFRLGDKVDVYDLRASLPLSAFRGGFSQSWQGTLQTQIKKLSLEHNWPTALIGNVEAHNLNGPARQPADIGSYKVTFDKTTQTSTREIIGHVISFPDAPLDVDGKLNLLPNRQYSIDAQVATRANAPASINQALQYLGTPDAQGKRTLSLAGSL